MQCIIATDGDATYVVYNFYSSTILYRLDENKASIGVKVDAYKRINPYNDKTTSTSIPKFVGNTGEVLNCPSDKTIL